jgi:hypothetical protein
MVSPLGMASTPLSFISLDEEWLGCTSAEERDRNEKIKTTIEREKIQCLHLVRKHGIRVVYVALFIPSCYQISSAPLS